MLCANGHAMTTRLGLSWKIPGTPYYSARALLCTCTECDQLIEIKLGKSQAERRALRRYRKQMQAGLELK